MNYLVTDAQLTGIADAIRTKGNTSSPLIFPDGFTSAIGAIQGGGGATILDGTSDPSSSLGSDGNLYFKYYSNTITGDDVVPSGVKKIKYIENADDGNTTNYIDIGYHGKQTSRYIGKFEVTAPQTKSQYPTLFGGRSAYSSLSDCSYFHLNNYLAWGSNQYQPAASFMNYVGDIDIELYAGYFKINEYEYTFTPSTVSDTGGFALLGAIMAGYSASPQAVNNARMMYFEIYESDVLVHRYIPVKDSNDVVCVYDTVGGQYYYPSSGTMTGLEAIDGEIVNSYLKVNGAWQSLIGQNIEDVA